LNQWEKGGNTAPGLVSLMSCRDSSVSTKTRSSRCITGMATSRGLAPDRRCVALVCSVASVKSESTMDSAWNSATATRSSSESLSSISWTTTSYRSGSMRSMDDQSPLSAAIRSGRDRRRVTTSSSISINVMSSSSGEDEDEDVEGEEKEAGEGVEPMRGRSMSCKD
jgi:hypothetical protein